MRVTKSGSVRVDLLGGTLDIHPINLVIPNVVTLNMATGLTANVILEDGELDTIKFISNDYDLTKTYSLNELDNIDSMKELFGPFEFLARILRFFSPTSGLTIELSSGAPPGSGLGGSSAMGAVFFSACCDFFSQKYSASEIVRIVQNIESKILNAGPAGYQDYYPSLYGGILALKSFENGVTVEQLYNKELASFICDNIRLIFSGESRNSGINNWEVYKGFFDGDEAIRRGLNDISSLSLDAYRAIKSNNHMKLMDLISKEGGLRESLFPSILSSKMKEFKSELNKFFPQCGMKVCGAGGGGCFVITNAKDIELKILLDKFEMRELPLEINLPH